MSSFRATGAVKRSSRTDSYARDTKSIYGAARQQQTSTKSFSYSPLVSAGCNKEGGITIKIRSETDFFLEIVLEMV